MENQHNHPSELGFDSDTKHVSNCVNSLITRSIFWRPQYLYSSAWLEHIPFAFWLVESIRPKQIVELGAHYGTSYFSFCQAVANLELDTECYAIDTWSADEHQSTNNEEIYAQVATYNLQNYFSFSTLVRSTFDHALEHFDDSSIDLLHIDGLHSFDTMSHTFESWLPKLSPNAVVIMHNTNVRARGFGVFSFFNELKRQYPHFEFSHGHGLGVIGVGNKQLASMQALYALSSNPYTLQRTREIFSHLGKACSDSRALLDLELEMVRQARESKEIRLYEQEQYALERGGIAAQINSQQKELVALHNKIAEYQEQEFELIENHQKTLVEIERRHQNDLEQLQQQISVLAEHNHQLEACIRERFHELAAMTRHADNLTRELERKEQLVQQARERTQRLKKSVSWKLTAPVRAIARSFQNKGEPSSSRMSESELIANSGLFDERWYREHYPEVANNSLSAIEHYLELGAEQGYNPSPEFDTRWYINTYPDVAQSAINPLIHYIMHGKAEQRHCLATN